MTKPQPLLNSFALSPSGVKKVVPILLIVLFAAFATAPLAAATTVTANTFTLDTSDIPVTPATPHRLISTFSNASTAIFNITLSSGLVADFVANASIISFLFEVGDNTTNLDTTVTLTGNATGYTITCDTVQMSSGLYSAGNVTFFMLTWSAANTLTVSGAQGTHNQDTTGYTTKLHDCYISVNEALTSTTTLTIGLMLDETSAGTYTLWVLMPVVVIMAMLGGFVGRRR